MCRVAYALGGKLFGQPIYKSASEIPEKIEGVVISISAKFTVDALTGTILEWEADHC